MKTASPSGSRRLLARGIGLLALAGTIGPPALVMTGMLADATMQRIMLASAVAWFAAAPFWMDLD